MLIVLGLLVVPLVAGATVQSSTILQPSVSSRDLLELVDKPVAEIEFVPNTIADPVKEKFLILKTKPFRPAHLRQLIIWFQETSGDTSLDVQASKLGSGVRLVISIREKPKVKEIAIEGASAFSSNVLLSLLELKAGADVDGALIDSSVKKILTFYNSQGFADAKVSSVMDSEKRLVFHVEEGSPAVVDEVAFSPIDTVSDKAQRRRLEVSLRESLNIEPGQRLVREKVTDGIIAVRNWLRDHDFLTARDPQVKTEKLANGKVKVFVDTQFGPRIRFGFRNNKRFSNRELQTQVVEVKEVSVGLDYIESVRRRILDSYADVGLVNAKINTIVREDQDSGIKSVSLIVDEGQKVRIAKLKIDGLFSMAEEEKSRLFMSFAPRLVQRGYFHEAGVQRAGELLAEHMRANGYLSAKLEFNRVDFNEQRTAADIYLLFNEGIQTKVGHIELNGFRNLSHEAALMLLGQREGQPFNVFAFEKGLVAIKDFYLDYGHLNAAILNEGSDTIVKYSQDQSEVALRVDVDEGQPVKLGEIIVRGNSMTHTRVVTREVPLISGDILTRPLLKEIEDNIRRLNLFSSVLVRPIEHPSSDDMRDLLILVEETVPGLFEVSPGFRNDLGFRLAIGSSYQNLGGWHRGVSARAIVNRRTEDYRFPEYNISFGFREPYFANWPVTFLANLNFLKRQFNRFDANISRITTGFRRELSRYLTGLIEYSYERSSIYNVEFPYTIADEGTNFIGAMIPGIIVDSRNDKFNPSSGIHSNAHFERAARVFGTEADISYTRITNNNSFYWSIVDGLVLAVGLNFGYERSNIAGKEIPILKLFRLGGISSLRGYKEDGIEVESQRDITGSLTMANYRTELRFPVFDSFGGALFFDAGNLFVDHFVPFRVRSAAGMGLRYITPVGPVVLDLAKKLSLRDAIGDTRLSDDTDKYRIHFAIGVF